VWNSKPFRSEIIDINSELRSEILWTTLRVEENNCRNQIEIVEKKLHLVVFQEEEKKLKTFSNQKIKKIPKLNSTLEVQEKERKKNENFEMSENIFCFPPMIIMFN
jgi:hypothetical protein